MEARSKPFCNKFIAVGLEQIHWFCIPTLQVDRPGDRQGSSGKCRSNDTSDAHMAETTLAYLPTKNVHTTSIAFTSPPKPITKSTWRKTSSAENQDSTVNGAANYRKSLKINGTSSSVAKLIAMSKRPDSIAGYRSVWNKWVRWFCAPLSGILNYLSKLFEKGLQYRAINSHHYAFSEYCDYVNEKPFGEHPRVFCFLTAVLN